MREITWVEYKTVARNRFWLLITDYYDNSWDIDYTSDVLEDCKKKAEEISICHPTFILDTLTGAIIARTVDSK